MLIKRILKHVDNIRCITTDRKLSGKNEVLSTEKEFLSCLKDLKTARSKLIYIMGAMTWPLQKKLSWLKMKYDQVLEQNKTVNDEVEEFSSLIEQYKRDISIFRDSIQQVEKERTSAAFRKTRVLTLANHDPQVQQLIEEHAITVNKGKLRQLRRKESELVQNVRRLTQQFEQLNAQTKALKESRKSLWELDAAAAEHKTGHPTRLKILEQAQVLKSNEIANETSETPPHQPSSDSKPPDIFEAVDSFVHANRLSEMLSQMAIEEEEKARLRAERAKQKLAERARRQSAQDKPSKVKIPIFGKKAALSTAPAGISRVGNGASTSAGSTIGSVHFATRSTPPQERVPLTSNKLFGFGARIDDGLSASNNNKKRGGKHALRTPATTHRVDIEGKGIADDSQDNGNELSSPAVDRSFLFYLGGRDFSSYSLPSNNEDLVGPDELLQSPTKSEKIVVEGQPPPHSPVRTIGALFQGSQKRAFMDTLLQRSVPFHYTDMTADDFEQNFTPLNLQRLLELRNDDVEDEKTNNSRNSTRLKGRNKLKKKFQPKFKSKMKRFLLVKQTSDGLVFGSDEHLDLLEENSDEEEQTAKDNAESSNTSSLALDSQQQHSCTSCPSAVTNDQDADVASEGLDSFKEEGSATAVRDKRAVLADKYYQAMESWNRKQFPDEVPELPMQMTINIIPRKQLSSRESQLHDTDESNHGMEDESLQDPNTVKSDAVPEDKSSQDHQERISFDDEVMALMNEKGLSSVISKPIKRSSVGSLHFEENKVTKSLDALGVNIESLVTMSSRPTFKFNAYRGLAHSSRAISAVASEISDDISTTDNSVSNWSAWGQGLHRPSVSNAFTSIDAYHTPVIAEIRRSQIGRNFSSRHSSRHSSLGRSRTSGISVTCSRKSSARSVHNSSFRVSMHGGQNTAMALLAKLQKRRENNSFLIGALPGIGLASNSKVPAHSHSLSAKDKEGIAAGDISVLEMLATDENVSSTWRDIDLFKVSADETFSSHAFTFGQDDDVSTAEILKEVNEEYVNPVLSPRPHDTNQDDCPEALEQNDIAKGSDEYNNCSDVEGSEVPIRENVLCEIQEQESDDEDSDSSSNSDVSINESIAATAIRRPDVPISSAAASSPRMKKFSRASLHSITRKANS